MHRFVLSLVFFSVPLVSFADSLPSLIVAKTGDAAPGTGGPTFLSFPLYPRLGVNGHVAFQATLSGAASSSDSGFWVGTPGNLQVAIRENTDPNGPISFTGNMGVDQNGYVSIWSQLNAQFFEDQQMNAYLPNGNGGVTLIAREGTTVAPGFGGGVFSNIGSGQAANNAGHIAFIASVTGGDTTFESDQGLFTGTPGNLKLIAREGSPAPGATGTAPVFSTTTSYPTLDRRINNAGQVAFSAQLSGAGVTTANGHAIYVWTPSGGSGTLALATQTGNTAPGLGSSTIRFNVIDESPGFNDSGEVVFRGQLIGEAGDGVNLTNNYGIWKGTPGNLELVVRSGTPSPIPGVQIRSQDPNPRINASGEVAFVSVLVGTGVINGVNDRAIWVTTPSGFGKIARRGEAAPGTGAGVTFSNFLDGTQTQPPVINALGQVAFTGTLTGTGVTTANDRGLWAGTPDNVSLVVREGDIIDIDPGPGVTNRTISTFQFANGFIRHAVNASFESATAALNDSGQIAWQATFTAASGGGSAIFLTQLPSITAPPLDGDYNDDGIVDAADYVMWRKLDGTSTDMENDPNPVPIDIDQYNTWRANFGNSDVGSGGSNPAVPEPTAMVLVALAVASMAQSRRRAPHV